MKRLAFILLAALVIGYVSICVLVFTQQRKLLFPAPTQRTPIEGKSVLVEVPGGTHLLWRQVEGDGPVVVHFHGNGEQVSNEAWLAEAFAVQGISFAAVEYPGYAGTAGEPTEASLVAAADAALAHLSGSMGISRQRLVLSGQSVGTGVAVAMAAKGWGTRLLLLTPYTSLPDVAARVFPWLPVRLLMRDRLDSASRAAEVKVPVLVIHGTDDEVIPFDLGQTLATKFTAGRFVQVPRGHHNDLWGNPQVVHEVMRFVRGP